MNPIVEYQFQIEDLINFINIIAIEFYSEGPLLLVEIPDSYRHQGGQESQQTYYFQYAIEKKL